MRDTLAGMDPASPKLQKAGRTFLLRLVAENGAGEAARILRDLADELEGLAEASCDGEVNAMKNLETYGLAVLQPALVLSAVGRLALAERLIE